MLRTRSPLSIAAPFDLHVSDTPLAFVLSQDQTLHDGPSQAPPPIPPSLDGRILVPQKELVIYHKLCSSLSSIPLSTPLALLPGHLNLDAGAEDLAIIHSPLLSVNSTRCLI